VVNHGLDEALTLEVLDGDTGERSVDLHAVNEDRLRDELEGGDLLHDAVESGLVADDGVVGLVLDLKRWGDHGQQENNEGICRRV
jgi:hypothetical protein